MTGAQKNAEQAGCGDRGGDPDYDRHFLSVQSPGRRRLAIRRRSAGLHDQRGGHHGARADCADPDQNRNLHRGRRRAETRQTCADTCDQDELHRPRWTHFAPKHDNARGHGNRGQAKHGQPCTAAAQHTQDRRHYEPRAHQRQNPKPLAYGHVRSIQCGKGSKRRNKPQRQPARECECSHW